MYQILAKEEADDNWLLFEDDCSGVLIPRPEYKELVCPSCCKINERSALQIGVSNRFKVPGKKDIYSSSDEYLLVSRRLRDFILTSGVKGLKFCPIPSTDNYCLMACDHFVKVNHEKVGFEYIDRCSRCDRYSEIIVGPLIAGLHVPDDPLTVFCAEIANENVKVSYYPIFATKTVKKLIENEKFSGILFEEAW